MRVLRTSAAVVLVLLAARVSSAACGDLDIDLDIDGDDVVILREHLAGLDPMSHRASLRCNVIEEARPPELAFDPRDVSGPCSMADAVVMARHAAAQGPGAAAVCPAGSTEPCCSVHPGPGCASETVTSCACGADPLCCTVGWDSRCAGAAATSCAPSCEVGSILCGCECVGPQTDIEHCGSCGNRCVNPHGSTDCSGGLCTPVCDGPWGACSLTAADGCETSLTTLTDCGAWGNLCPGVGQEGTANIEYDGTSCGFSCQGENYDVDSSPANGCEEVDTPLNNHTQSNHTFIGSLPCTDGSSNPNISGVVVSDARLHESPSINGFDGESGSAPDWYRIFGDGGLFCQNDIALTLLVSGSAFPTCYRLVVYTTEFPGGLACNTNGGGSCNVNNSVGAYAENTSIFLEISKTCSADMMSEIVTYTVTGHL